jgi:hypothetical protein
MVAALGLERDLEALDLDSNHSGDADTVFLTGGSGAASQLSGRGAANAAAAALRTVARVVELFNEVDAAGSGFVGWAAFSGHLVGHGSSTGGNAGDKDVRYHTDRWQARPAAFAAKSSARKYQVASLRWAPECQRLFVCVDDRVEVQGNAWLYSYTKMLVYFIFLIARRSAFVCVCVSHVPAHLVPNAC